MIATDGSNNAKTGPMLQTWILREDLSPIDASKAGADVSICGDCPQRWHLGGARYVNIGQAPGSVWRAYKRGRYQDASENALLRTVIGQGKRVRLGAYGDPAAVPTGIWIGLTMYANGWTGYTHQWRQPFAAALRGLCMASCDNTADFEAAQRDGWRTFRITSPADILEPGEFICPSESTGRQCSDCMACDGATGRSNAASVAITVHGPKAVRFMNA